MELGPYVRVIVREHERLINCKEAIVTSPIHHLAVAKRAEVKVREPSEGILAQEADSAPAQRCRSRSVDRVS